MFGKKKKMKRNPFESVPYLTRGIIYNALVRYNSHLFRELDKNGAYDDDGNFVSENDWEIDMRSEMAAVDDLIRALYDVGF